MVEGAAPHGRPQVTQEGDVGRAGELETTWTGGEEKEWTDGVAKDLRAFCARGDWSTATLDPGILYNIVCKEGCRFMGARTREEGKASRDRHRKIRAK